MQIKHNLHFRLFRYGKDNNKYQIRARITFNGERIDVSSGIVLDSPNKWDPLFERVIGDGALSFNAVLLEIRDKVELVLKEFEIQGYYPSAKDFRIRLTSMLKGISKEERVAARRKDSAPKFFEVMDKFMLECGEKNAWTVATYQKWDALRKDLFNFKPSLSFDDLNENVLISFVSYLRDNKPLTTPRKPKGQRLDYDPDDVTGIKNSTLEKKLEYLRWFLNWATTNGYNNNLAYKSFRPTLKKTQKKVIYLSKEELARIQSLDLTNENEYLDPVRDVFLFCCFSGLRHSDANNLYRSDIKDGHIEITTVKTADSLKIELNDVTQAILDKYKDVPFKDNKALPSLTNQAMNRDLKVLCKLAGICEEIRVTTYKGSERRDEICQKWELIGTHTGRRTFIVNALSLGIPPSIVMKWTGHNDYKAMKPYIDIVDTIKADSMARFNQLL